MSFSVSTNNIIPGSDGKPILIDYYESKEFNGHTIIFAHGYKGYKDWGAWHLAAKQFASKGFNFVKFNFSHNGGTVSQPIDFPDLETFSKNTYSKELYDLSLVIKETKNWLTKNKKPISITLIGHSRGGGDAILQSAIDSEIQALITWSAIGDIFSRFPSGEKLSDWKEKGMMYETNKRTKQEMPVRIDIYKDAVDNKVKLDIPASASKIRIPWLIIHGDQDEAVSYNDALLLKSKCPSAILINIKGAGHTYGVSHPYTNDFLPDEFQQVVNKSIEFLENNL